MRTKIFSTKAEKYARFRWDYAPPSITAVYTIANLSASSRIADIGAGTGNLTRHFLGQMNRVYAVEPNKEMRQSLDKKAASHPECIVLDSTAEKTGIPTGIIDLITVGTALHWFDPVPARLEFIRILKPGGWLAIFRNENNNQALNEAMEAAFDPAWHTAGVDIESIIPVRKPDEFFFGHSHYEHHTYPFSIYEPWEHFFGAWCSLSYAPNEHESHFKDFERAAHDVFDRFVGEDGLIPIHGLTRLAIGRVLS